MPRITFTEFVNKAGLSAMSIAAFKTEVGTFDHRTADQWEQLLREFRSKDRGRRA